MKVYKELFWTIPRYHSKVVNISVTQPCEIRKGVVALLM